MSDTLIQQNTPLCELNIYKEIINLLQDAKNMYAPKRMDLPNKVLTEVFNRAKQPQAPQEPLKKLHEYLGVEHIPPYQRIPQAPPLAPDIQFCPPSKPALTATRPTIMPREWNRLKELTRLAEKGQLTPGSEGTEEEFEALVETIQREVDTHRTRPDTSRRELLNAVLSAWDLLRARQSY